jgi:hypothetical protein
VIPAVLLMFTVANAGDEFEFSTGATVPLKLITPVDDEVIELMSWNVCTRVPVKVAVPLLTNVPLTVRSPSRIERASGKNEKISRHRGGT